VTRGTLLTSTSLHPGGIPSFSAPIEHQQWTACIGVGSERWMYYDPALLDECTMLNAIAESIAHYGLRP
jgi:hypothetical protein